MGKEIKKERERPLLLCGSSESLQKRKSLYKTTVKWLSGTQLMDEIQFSFNVKRLCTKTGNDR